MSQVTLKREDTAIMPVWFMAMELSSKRWKVAFSNGMKRRHVTVAAGGRVNSLVSNGSGHAGASAVIPRGAQALSGTG